MADTIVVTARITEQLSADLDRLATMRDRSRAWLVQKAIAAFVREELELRLSLAEADAQIDCGDGIAHEDLMAEMRTEFGVRHAA